MNTRTLVSFFCRVDIVSLFGLLNGCTEAPQQLAVGADCRDLLSNSTVDIVTRCLTW